ncbi:MAG: hypothetical protein ABI661_13015 [Gammaproteobacteria bacterium]
METLPAFAQLLRQSQLALRFLADASDCLSQSLDHTVTVPAVAALAVPGIADACFVELLELLAVLT